MSAWTTSKLPDHRGYGTCMTKARRSRTTLSCTLRSEIHMTDRVTCSEWNGWVLDAGRSAFIHEPEGYGVDFDRLLTPTDIVFWIFQLNSKGWGIKALPGFIMALDDVLDPQGNQTYTGDGIRVQVEMFIKDPQIPVTHLP
jgi:hypothetical protein